MPPGKYVKGRWDSRRFPAFIRVSPRGCWRSRRQTVQAITDLAENAGLESIAMGVKYYTHFVLTGEAAAGEDQEFSGIVEVNRPTGHRFETKEIEALLARNFDLRSADVRLLNWARLQ
jgi:hypothetical protein